MANEQLDWMAQWLLDHPGNLYYMPKHPEKFLSNFDPNKKTKVEDHIDDFYMHLQMLEVHFYDITCRHIPYTLEGRALLWYHNLLPNLILCWRDLKKLF